MSESFVFRFFSFFSGKAIDIIEAPNTIANSTRAENDRAHMLFEVVRPQGKFVRAIERQRFNILALSVFSKNKKGTPPDARLSCVLSKSLLKPPTIARQRFNLVTNLVKCANSLASERRATIASQRELQGRNTLKDVEMRQKGHSMKPKMTKAESVSQMGYEDFLSKKQTERGKELQIVGRSAGSNVAKRAATVKQTSSKGKKGKHTPVEEPDQNQESWNKKCVVACKTSRR